MARGIEQPSRSPPSLPTGHPFAQDHPLPVQRFAIIHHADYVGPAAPGSRYAWNKYGLVRDLLMHHADRIDWIEPEPMPPGWVGRVHDPAYVAEVTAAAVPLEKERRIGYPVTPAVSRRAFRVPGGTWTAATVALERGFAINSAGGSHHALRETGAGYCVFNDLAITAVRMIAEDRAERVLVVDCDVHQGDGTAALTAGMPAIATYSIHAERNFPVRKAASTLDVPLPDGTGDAAYLALLERTLPPLLDDFAPGLILYQGGVDPHGADRLGRLALTDAGLDARDRYVAGLARGAGVPLAATLGGGYGTDVMEVAARHVRSLLTLADAYD